MSGVSLLLSLVLIYYSHLQINGIGGTGFAFGNFATIMAISMDRYLTVVWSNRFPPSKRRIIIFIILSWTFPIANTIPPSFELISDFKYHPLTHHCTPVWEVCLYYSICNIIVFGITVPVMVFCYIGVFWTLRRQQQVLRSYTDENVDDSEQSKYVNNPSISLDNLSGQGGNVSETMEEFSSSNLDDHVVHGSEKGKNNQQETVKKKKQTAKRRSLQNKLTTDKRIALTGTLLVMTTVICWAPYSIVHACFIPIHATHSLGVFSMWLGYTNALLDPIIYSFMNRRVRARYRAMMTSLRMYIYVRLNELIAVFTQDCRY
ncbi:5-hydroxytryptamine receptor 1-like [Strongylocentrotus purpuratus]|uniref:G-protein coupled receptors family 1 profile domain-containing protein n=1 Tax=Strongylocentrotus purpuratus TaxID=7668 RepID=A0A7M7PP17_STRPU|nr:5-hydroxytryptamine receptor 1-like [Strongylocentrotus purpuratus]